MEEEIKKFIMETIAKQQGFCAIDLEKKYRNFIGDSFKATQKSIEKLEAYNKKQDERIEEQMDLAKDTNSKTTEMYLVFNNIKSTNTTVKWVAVTIATFAGAAIAIRELFKK